MIKVQSEGGFEKIKNKIKIKFFDFDDEFDNKIQPIVKQEKKMYLETLVLNKCKVDFYTLIRLSPLFISLDISFAVSMISAFCS